MIKSKMIRGEGGASMQIILAGLVFVSLSGMLAFASAPARADDKPIVGPPIIKHDPPKSPPKKDFTVNLPGVSSGDRD